MKANEAPDKIYVEINHPFSEEYTEMIAFEDGDGIEYIRTDAFIKKACEWIKELMIASGNYDAYDIQENLKDFKKAMKGK